MYDFTSPILSPSISKMYLQIDCHTARSVSLTFLHFSLSHTSFTTYLLPNFFQIRFKLFFTCVISFNFRHSSFRRFRVLLTVAMYPTYSLDPAKKYFAHDLLVPFCISQHYEFITGKHIYVFTSSAPTLNISIPHPSNGSNMSSKALWIIYICIPRIATGQSYSQLVQHVLYLSERTNIQQTCLRPLMTLHCPHIFQLWQAEIRPKTDNCW